MTAAATVTATRPGGTQRCRRRRVRRRVPRRGRASGGSDGSWVRHGGRRRRCQLATASTGVGRRQPGWSLDAALEASMGEGSRHTLIDADVPDKRAACGRGGRLAVDFGSVANGCDSIDTTLDVLPSVLDSLPQNRKAAGLGAAKTGNRWRRSSTTVHVCCAALHQCQTCTVH